MSELSQPGRDVLPKRPLRDSNFKREPRGCGGFGKTALPLCLFLATFLQAAPPVRIHIPVGDLPAVQKKHPKAVLLTAAEYDALLLAAEANPKDPVPSAVALRTADYTASVSNGQFQLRGNLGFSALGDGPFDLVLPFRGLGLEKVLLGGNSAPLWYGDNGRMNLRLPGPGEHKLKISGSLPIQDTPGGGSQFNLHIPMANSGKLTLHVPGDQEIRANVPVIHTEFDQGNSTTKIELAAGGRTLVQGLLIGNGHRQDQRAILVGNSATTVTLDQAGQVLDAYFSVQVLRQGVRKFNFLLDPSWTLTDVQSPDLVSWSTVPADDNLQKVEITLGHASTGTKGFNFQAYAPTAGFNWSAPRLLLEDADFQRGHLLVDPGASRTFRAETLSSVLRQDLSTANRVEGLTSSDGRLYFHWGEDWDTSVVFAPVQLERHSEEEILLIASPSGLAVEGKFEVTAVGFNMAHLLFQLPPRGEGWELANVRLGGSTKGFEYQLRNNEAGQELRMDFDKAVPPEGLAKVRIVLKKVPEGWETFLSSNSLETTTGQVFPLIRLDAVKTKGLAAFSALGHLESDAGNVPESWTPVNVGKLGALGLGNEVRSAFRYHEPAGGTATASIHRGEPMTQASSSALYTLSEGNLSGSFRVPVKISRAPAQRFFFLAEKSLGEEISFQVQAIQERRLASSKIVDPGEGTLGIPPETAARYNLWQLDLDEGTTGNLQFDIFFRQALDGSSHDVPLVRPAGMGQVSEFAAIEAGEEFEVEILASGTREIDPIDLPTLPGNPRRILSAHRFLAGEDITFQLSPKTLEAYAIPSVLALEVRLKTQVGIQGSQQTEATWKVANVSAQFLPVQLPEGAELWSAQVAGNPVKPKAGNAGVLNLPLPLSREPVDVSVVYFLAEGANPLAGLQLQPPLIPGVPNNESHWEVFTPKGYKVSDYESNLSTGKIRRGSPAFFSLFELGFLGAADMAYPGAGVPESADMEQTEEHWYAEGETTAVEPAMPAEPEPNAIVDEKVLNQLEDISKKEAEKAGALLPEGTASIRDSMLKRMKDIDTLSEVSYLRSHKAEGRNTLPVQVVTSGSGRQFNGLGLPKLSVTLSRSGDEVVGFLGFLTGFCLAILAVLKLLSCPRRYYFPGALAVSTLVALWMPGLFDFANGYFGGSLLGLFLWPFWLLFKKIFSSFWKWVSQSQSLAGWRKAVFRISWGCLMAGLFLTGAQQTEAKTVYFPYPDKLPDLEGEAGRVLLPYADYEKLWNQAHPGNPMLSPRKAPRIFLRKPVYKGILVDADTFELKLEVAVEVDAPGAVDFPLPFNNLAVKECLFDGQPANISAQKGGGILLRLEPGATGTLEVLAVGKPETRGRAGSISMSIPPLPAAVMRLDLGDEGLEPEVAGLLGKPVREGGSWQFPAGNLNKFQLQWRPEAGEGSGDRTLSAHSDHQTHVFHWGIIGVSQIHYKFAGGEHDRFLVLLPSGVRVSSLESSNLRDHRIANELELDSGRFQAMEVRLHKPATKGHNLTLRWVAPFPEEAVPARMWLPRAGEVGRESGNVGLHSALEVGVKVLSVEGGRRTNQAVAQANHAEAADSSRLKGAYEWPFRPFSLQWEVERESSSQEVVLRQLVRISPEEVQLLGNIVVRGGSGLVFGSTFLVPVGYEVLNVVGPDIERWHIQEEGMGNLLHVDFRVAREETSLAIVLVQEAPLPQEFDLPLLRAATSSGQLLEGQKGQVAVQVAPALEASTLESGNLKPKPRNSVAGWLDSSQVRAVQFAYDSEGADAMLKLGIRKRPTEVRLEMLCGVLVEETAAHYTYRLRYHVEGSPLDKIRFTLPEEVANGVALVSPALRGIQHQAVEGGLHEWEVSLVNEVTGLVDIGVNFSRDISADTDILAIPELVTVAGAGYRVVVAVQNESRHQLDFQGSSGMRTATVEEQQDLLDEDLRSSLQFVYQGFQPGWEAVMGMVYAKETKRLEAVIDLLSMKTFASKSGDCVYEVTLSLQNRAEQFIVLGLPENLRLWSAQVDGQPVKPVYPDGAGMGQVAVPLVKTTVAGLPFEAKLFLAGNLGMELKPGVRVEPPSIKVTNIPVKRTNWSLFLPDSFDYRDPKGNMDPAAGTTELLAYGIEAKLEQLKRVSKVAKSKKGYGGRKLHWKLQSSLSKELGLLEQQIDSNTNDINYANDAISIEAQGRLNEQLQQQRVALQTLNEQLAGDGEDSGIVLVNGFLNASCVNPGLSEWDRNGALNILPSFVTSAQEGQVANLNYDFNNNAILLNQEAPNAPPAQFEAQAPAQPISQVAQSIQVGQATIPTLGYQSAEGLLGAVHDRPPVDASYVQVDSLDDALFQSISGVQVTNDALNGSLVHDNSASMANPNNIAGRNQQLFKRQQTLESQIGNLADNRLNRFYASKGRNTANAKGKGQAKAPMDLGEPQSQTNTVPSRLQMESGDTVFTFANSDFSNVDAEQGQLGPIRLQAATEANFWLDARNGGNASFQGGTNFNFADDPLDGSLTNAGFVGGLGGGGGGGQGQAQPTGTYSLTIPFPEGGRRFDFSYPGDDPHVSLKIHDMEARNRNVATVGVLLVLGLFFSLPKFLGKQRRSDL